MSDVEIITDGGRRRRWSAAEKLCVVEETLDVDGGAPQWRGPEPALPLAKAHAGGRERGSHRGRQRNHVQVTPLPDAALAPASIGICFNHHNEHHAPFGLLMRSPREFSAAQTATA